ncbi:hypothetical protein CDAR_278431 [Caerostris darwini]|uniref:Uncharacterized protein n=1 Tax=Caerostris darwini TaxID=1538125 RepID=A0AAV4WNX6_9ARAC|nr:hypothetical protein CDAR_278431 [Caerostris darwini]
MNESGESIRLSLEREEMTMINIFIQMGKPKALLRDRVAIVSLRTKACARAEKKKKKKRFHEIQYASYVRHKRTPEVTKLPTTPLCEKGAIKFRKNLLGLN